MAELKEARVPDIGGHSDVPIIEVLVKPGDTVTVDQGLVTLESDKATMEVPSPFAGVVKELKVKLGDEISEGALVAIIEVAGAAAAPAAPASAEPPRAEPIADKPTVAAAETGAKVEPVAVSPTPDKLTQMSIAASEAAPMGAGLPPVRFSADAVLPDKVPYASPAVRLYARELGVDLAQVSGSERGGRIGKEDVQKFVKGVLSGAPAGAASAPAAAAGGGLNLIPWPKVEFDDADITGLEDLRVALNDENAKAIAAGKAGKVTMLAFLIKACVAALKKYPTFNASLEGDNLVLKKYFHIGFAADTPNGLVVPVLRDADKKGVMEIAREMGELAALARDGKLKPEQMQGGCFTISSLGGIGGTAFTPIINAPEVAILGVSKSDMKPVWDGKAFQPRLVLPLSLSYDHRVIDGAAAARFTAYLAQLLADMRRAML